MDVYRVWLLALALRVFGSLFVGTYFNPDEYWQSVEVAHKVVFGYGFLTWEWHPFARLRGFLHPAIFAVLFKLLQILGLDTPLLIVYSPRILQAIIASLGDVFLYKLTERWFGSGAAKWALFCQMIDWFYFFVIIRTFSNCIETVLTVMAMYWWPWPSLSSSEKRSPLSNRVLALSIAALAVLIRPTSAVIWIILGLNHLVQTQDKVRFLFGEVLPIGAFAIIFSCIVDRVFYGEWTVVPYNFVLFNVLQDGSKMYGTHPWHWYFSQGSFAVLGTCTPFFLMGVYLSKRYWPAIVITFVTAVYSLNPHKEFRFILPILPLAFMYCGYALSTLDLRQQHSKKYGALMNPCIAFLLLSNIPAIYFFSRVHQRAPVAIMEHVFDRLSDPSGEDNPIHSVHFLTSCHATPFYSSVHRNIPMRQLDCSPKFEGAALVGDRSESESELFLASPRSFVDSFYGASKEEIPTHLVIFNEHLEALQPFLKKHGFEEEKQFFYSYFESSRYLFLFGRVALV